MRALRAWAPAALVFCVVALGSPALAGAQSAGGAALATVISQDGLNLRQSPNTTSVVLQVIPYASVITVTGAPAADHWYPVMWGTLVGWADGDYLTAGSLTSDTAKTAMSLTASSGAGPIAARAATPSGIIVPPSSPPPPVAGASVGVSTSSGTSYRAMATYYGIDDGATQGRMMACGSPFDPMNAHAAATNDWSCGTKLRVTGSDGRNVDVVVTDHGMYPTHWVDLTYAAFGVISDHKAGTIQVTVEVLR